MSKKEMAAEDRLFRAFSRAHRTEIHKGDVWRDLDKRHPVERLLVVEEPRGPMGKVVMRPVGGGKPTRIARERLEKGQGWGLVSRAESPAIAGSDA